MNMTKFDSIATLPPTDRSSPEFALLNKLSISIGVPTFGNLAEEALDKV